MNSLQYSDGGVLSRADRIRILTEIFHLDRVKAEFMIDIEDRKISGDIVRVDESGKEIKP